MGYFSSLDASLSQRGTLYLDHSYPVENTLETQLEILQERLAELDAVRPHDRMDPLYDRYISGADYYTDEYGPTESVEDLYAKIYAVKMKLLEKYLARWRWENEINSIKKTGATKAGQLAMISVFLPEWEACVA